MVLGARLFTAVFFLGGIANAAPLLSFPAGKTDFATWMSAGGWQSKRDRPDGWEIVDGTLRLVSAGNSALIGTEAVFPSDVASSSRLRVTLKVKTVPRGTDLSRKAGDDAAFRLYLAFDRGAGLIRPPNTLAYAWTEKDDAGEIIPSAHFANLFYISLGKGPTSQGDWSVIERDLAADYRRVFPKETSFPRLKGLLLKCDSNDTNTSAESTLASIELVP